MSMHAVAVSSTGPFGRPGVTVSGEPDVLCGRVVQWRTDHPQQRAIIGLVGEPGAGKSTLARELVTALNGDVALVPMDGFHL